MNSFRRRILSVIEQTEESGIGNKIYAFGMFVVIVASMIPLAAKEPPETYRVLETVTFIVFVLD